MLQIGQMNKLAVTKHVDFGVYLEATDSNGVIGEILLPLKYVPPQCEVGDEVDVFVCYDSEDRLIATTEIPKVMVGGFALLKIVAIERVGAFLDWGLTKDLFLPYSEQTHYLDVDQDVVVYVYLDKSERISATMKLEKHLDKMPKDLVEGQSADLLVYDKTELGFKAVINGKSQGIIYQNEVFKPLEYGHTIKGFIKKIREDGKIDLMLAKTGHHGAEGLDLLILEKLKANSGFLAINEKTSAEKIYELFGSSKKKYKIALGGLYKSRLVTIDDEGVRIVKNPTA